MRSKARRRSTNTVAGDLAEELLKAAAALVAERGPQRFSLREVARRARVSEAAPYWHFASREALLTGVAEQGFTTLAAHGRGPPADEGSPQQLQELGRALFNEVTEHLRAQGLAVTAASNFLLCYLARPNHQPCNSFDRRAEKARA